MFHLVAIVHFVAGQVVVTAAVAVVEQAQPILVAGLAQQTA